MSSNILIVGGWSFRSSDLDPLVKAVPEGSTVTVLCAPDLPAPEGAPTPPLDERFAAAVQGQSFDLAIGWSLGGMLILDAVLQDRLHTRNLLLFSSCSRFLSAMDYLEGVPPRLQQVMQKMLKKDPIRCIRDFRDLSSYPNQTSHTESAWSLDELDEGLNFLSEFDVRHRLGEITPPTLIIHGEKDRVIQAKCAAYLADHIPNSRLLLLPDAGHDFCIRNCFGQADWIQQALEPVPV